MFAAGVLQQLSVLSWLGCLAALPTAASEDDTENYCGFAYKDKLRRGAITRAVSGYEMTAWPESHALTGQGGHAPAAGEPRAPRKFYCRFRVRPTWDATSTSRTFASTRNLDSRAVHWGAASRPGPRRASPPNVPR